MDEPAPGDERQGWVAFEGVVRPLPWGRSVYTVVHLPDELVEAAAQQRTRRVEGTVEGVEVNLGVNRGPVTPDAFVYVGKGLQARLGVVSGDVVECRLRPADPDHVPVPPDVAEALARAGAREAFDARRPAQQRRLLAPVEKAATDTTRARRIEALVREVASL